MKNLFLLKFVILSLIFSSCEEEEEMVINTATARVQVIHNSADLAAASVDIYLNNTLLIDDFNFRTASPFIDAPAGEEITISVAPSTSMSSSQALASFNYTLEENATYILVANGVISPVGYSPIKNFSIFYTFKTPYLCKKLIRIGEHSIPRTKIIPIFWMPRILICSKNPFRVGHHNGNTPVHRI